MSLEAWYFGIPIVTRVYITACFLLALVTQLELVNTLKLYFSFELIFKKFQFWRLFTNLVYFGELRHEFIFHMFFLYHYSRGLEEERFHGKPADYLFMLLFGSTIMTVAFPIIQRYFTVYFLASGLNLMLVYVWSKYKADTRMLFMGLFPFRAPYLPWILLGFSLLSPNSSIVIDVLGIVVGHIYFYLSDVFPREFGRSPLQTPRILKWLFQAPPPQVVDIPVENENIAQPGGYAWRIAEQQQHQQQQEQPN